METLSMLLTTVPLTIPAVLTFGFDPLWFGLLVIMLLVSTETALRLRKRVC